MRPFGFRSAASSHFHTLPSRSLFFSLAFFGLLSLTTWLAQGALACSCSQPAAARMAPAAAKPSSPKPSPRQAAANARRKQTAAQAKRHQASRSKARPKRGKAGKASKGKSGKAAKPSPRGGKGAPASGRMRLMQEGACSCVYATTPSVDGEPTGEPTIQHDPNCRCNGDGADAVCCGGGVLPPPGDEPPPPPPGDEPPPPGDEPPPPGDEPPPPPPGDGGGDPPHRPRLRREMVVPKASTGMQHWVSACPITAPKASTGTRRWACAWPIKNRASAPAATKPRFARAPSPPTRIRRPSAPCSRTATATRCPTRPSASP